MDLSNVRIRVYNPSTDYCQICKLFAEGMRQNAESSQSDHIKSHFEDKIKWVMNDDLPFIGQNYDLADPVNDETSLYDIGNPDDSDLKGVFLVAVINNPDSPTSCMHDTIIGMCGLRLEDKDKRRGELTRMSIKKSYQRTGLGSVLLAAIESWAQIHGFKEMFLITLSVMKPAISFYCKHGWVVVDQNQVAPALDPVHGTIFVLEKSVA